MRSPRSRHHRVLLLAAEGGKKDTLRNVEATGEFVVNVVDDEAPSR